MFCVWCSSITKTLSRKIGASKEQARREREAEERENGYAGATQDDDDDNMGL